MLQGGAAATLSLIDSASVTTASQLRNAVRSGVHHIIVKDHINMTDAVLGDRESGAIAWHQTREGQYTTSIRVRALATL